MYTYRTEEKVVLLPICNRKMASVLVVLFEAVQRRRVWSAPSFSRRKQHINDLLPDGQRTSIKSMNEIA
jgi:hypothetical protein